MTLKIPIPTQSINKKEVTVIGKRKGILTNGGHPDPKTLGTTIRSATEVTGLGISWALALNYWLYTTQESHSVITLILESD